jgi:hypothetical protein
MGEETLPTDTSPSTSFCICHLRERGWGIFNCPKWGF